MHLSNTFWSTFGSNYNLKSFEYDSTSSFAHSSRDLSHLLYVVFLLSNWPLPQFEVKMLLNRFLSWMFLEVAAFIFSSVLKNLPVPVAAKHSHSMMVSPPCFTVGMVLAWSWAVPCLLQTGPLAFASCSWDVIGLIPVQNIFNGFICLVFNQNQFYF